MADGTTTTTDEKRVDLVFEGGGVKGLGLVGALSVLEERGFQFQHVAGTSAGAIVASLVAAGYNSRELHDIMEQQDFRSFMDPTWEDRIPVAGQGLSILLNEGLYKGEYFLDWIRRLLAAKNIRTFGDLPKFSDSDDPRYLYKLQVIASDLTERCLLALPKDAARLGVDDPDGLEVAEAVRMSMSIPIFFEPVQFREPATGREHIIVDGGMLSNFPVWLFDSSGPPRYPTFGLKLVPPDPKSSLADSLPEPPPAAHGGVAGVIDYVKSIVGTMIDAHDRQYLEQDQFVRTITISTLGIGTTQFDLSHDQLEDLYQSGRTGAEHFLEAWYAAGGFPAYVAAFRSGPQPPRRQRVTEVMRSSASHMS